MDAMVGLSWRGWRPIDTDTDRGPSQRWWRPARYRCRWPLCRFAVDRSRWRHMSAKLDKRAERGGEMLRDVRHKEKPRGSRQALSHSGCHPRRHSSYVSRRTSTSAQRNSVWAFDKSSLSSIFSYLFSALILLVTGRASRLRESCFSNPVGYPLGDLQVRSGLLKSSKGYPTGLLTQDSCSGLHVTNSVKARRKKL